VSVTAVHDELPSATPIPSLADCAGREMLIHWAAQAVTQLEETSGAARPGRWAPNACPPTALDRAPFTARAPVLHTATPGTGMPFHERGVTESRLGTANRQRGNLRAPRGRHG
jgi:hypothetical protein